MTRSSEELFAAAKRYIPGGVNSPVRAFGSVGTTPRFIARAAGARVVDVDGREYLDYVASWGPLILGHARHEVVQAVAEAAGRGTSYGAPTEQEVAMAQLLTEAVGALDMVRLTSSGTEAAMSAIRLARAFTGREIIVKFDGCYHGHADSLLVEAGSGVATLGIPECPGIPRSLAAATISLPYNDAEACRRVVASRGNEVACIIVEAVAGNMGVVPPRPGFLEMLREITSRHGILLIFDEVITGFRLAFGGYQDLAGIRPDLTCLGKIIGGGLPVGAFGGRADIMERVAPAGDVYQAGTLSGNPVALAAGLTTLGILKRNEDIYATIDGLARRLCDGLGAAFTRKGIPVHINRQGSMFTLFFAAADVHDLTTAKRSDRDLFARYFRGMLAHGIMLPPSPFEACFVSAAHTERDIDKTIDACTQTLETL